MIKVYIAMESLLPYHTLELHLPDKYFNQICYAIDVCVQNYEFLQYSQRKLYKSLNFFPAESRWEKGNFLKREKCFR